MIYRVSLNSLNLFAVIIAVAIAVAVAVTVVQLMAKEACQLRLRLCRWAKVGRGVAVRLTE